MLAVTVAAGCSGDVVIDGSGTSTGVMVPAASTGEGPSTGEVPITNPVTEPKRPQPAELPTVQDPDPKQDEGGAP